MIKLIIFDLDGVLVDALTLHEDAFLEAVNSYGTIISREEHSRVYAHRPTKVKLRMLEEKGLVKRELFEKISEKKQALTQELIMKTIRPIKNVYETIEWLSKEHKLIIASNCVRDTVINITKASELDKFISGYVSNEDVTCPKPDPEMFMKAFAMAGCKNDEALIVEDSNVGLKAAYMSGAHVMEVFNPYMLTKDLAETRLKIIKKYCG